MKWMKKLRLINWHYFIDETMEFGKQTLITGQNAAGKSTIIDALQVLFIADQRLIRFNPAAHEEAKRTMIGYLRGKISSDERTYLRDGDFTTYITAEFRDEVKKESFIIGVVIDVYRDQQYEEEYFILADCRLDDLDFINSSGYLRNREEFRRRHGAHSDGTRRRSIFERNKTSYQKALLTRLGGLNDRFFRIFLKALSFKPLQNVREFVDDYILDEKELQLDVLRENFEIYQKYKREFELLLVRKEKLQGIRDVYEQYDKLRQTVQEQEYVIRRLKLTLQEEQLDMYQRQRAELEDDLRRLQKDLVLAKEKHEEANAEKDKAHTFWKSHDSVRRERELRQKIDEWLDKKMQLQKELRFTKGVLVEELRLLEQLIDWPGNDRWTLQPDERVVLVSGMEIMAIAIQRLEEWLVLDSIKAKVGTASVNVDDLLLGTKELGGQFSRLYERLVNERGRVDVHIQQVTELIEELEQVIQNLEKKQRTYPSSVMNLKKILEERLGERSPVWIFCEEMEVEDEEWRNAVEGFLNTQRFDLLVRPEMFAEALSIYEQEKFIHQLEGVGLVDTDKVQRCLNKVETGSLAYVLRTDNPVIQAHIDHLLGRVMKAEDEQDLRRYRTAVTRTCMVYNNLVARQMKRKQYELPFIGAKAIERQLELKRQELVEATREREYWVKIYRELSEWAKKLADKKATMEQIGGQLALIPRYAETLQQLKQAEHELEQLDLSEARQLEQIYLKWKGEEERCRNRLMDLKEELGIKRSELKNISGLIYTQSNKVKDALQVLDSWATEHDPRLMQGALARLADAEKQDIPTSRKLENWQNNQKGNMTRRDDMLNEWRNLRHDFNKEYLFDGPLEAEDNVAYDEALRTVVDLDIPRYQAEVEQALKDSEEHFKTEFVYKMREAIDMAKREFHELNFALRHFPFSKDRYVFEVKPSEKYRRYYDAIMNPMLGENRSLFDL